MNDFLSDGYKDIPEMLEFSVKMEVPNEDIIIHEGIFILKGKDDIKVNGRIDFRWFPFPGVYFEGTLENQVSNNFYKEKYEIEIEGLYFSDCTVSRIITKIGKISNIQLFGRTFGNSISGDSKKTVSSVNFAIPNLKRFWGSQVLDKENGIWGSRLSFKVDNYEIAIDSVNNFDKLKRELNGKGGYLNIYAGKINKTENDLISLTEANSVLASFNYFISLLNGRRTSALFLRGIYENEVLWSDFTPDAVDTYKDSKNWTWDNPEVNYVASFTKFYELWKDENNCSLLKSLTGWYLEANNGFSSPESSIVKGQIALELLYNFLLIEKKGLILGKDAESISAANKIRLLLNHLNINYTIPQNFTHLEQYKKASNGSVNDAPDAIVQIRNAVVHGQLKKRQKISDLNSETKREALHLTIWYIELAIMFILEYDGLYINRCKAVGWANDMKELVPWSKNNGFTKP
jgi:hypothetical protein